jgi:type IV pilus assembly protein PilC
MKSFFWRGIDVFGKYQKGYLNAKSKEHLQNELLTKGVALLSFKLEKTRYRFLFAKKINLQNKAFFFEQLSVLIESGVDLLQALQLVAKQVDSKLLYHVVISMIDDVAFGKSLADAMKKCSPIFSTFMINLVCSGEHSGNLGFTLKKIAVYLNDCIKIKKKMKQAAFVPTVTLLFAGIIFVGIFAFVVPQFESFFNVMGGELPAMTMFVINTSRFFRSSYFLLIIIFFLCGLLFVKKVSRFGRLKRVKDMVQLKFFFVGTIVFFRDLIFFLQTLSLFLKTGVSLKAALHNASLVVQNAQMKKYVLLVEHAVIKGKSLSEAFRLMGKNFFLENLIAVVAVGESTGKLDVMLEKAARFFQDELDKRLKLVVHALQPLFMILIGILIFCLILSVYLPIFNMASLV